MIFARRRLHEQASLNLPAIPFVGPDSSIQIIALPTSRSSGSFPAVPDAKKKLSPPPALAPLASPPNPSSQNNQRQDSPKSSSNMWKYIVTGISVAVLLIVLVMMFFMCRSQAVKTIKPWKTGISGQLQKAFITGNMLIVV